MRRYCEVFKIRWGLMSQEIWNLLSSLLVLTKYFKNSKLYQFGSHPVVFIKLEQLVLTLVVLLIKMHPLSN